MSQLSAEDVAGGPPYGEVAKSSPLPALGGTPPCGGEGGLGFLPRRGRWPVGRRERKSEVSVGWAITSLPALPCDFTFFPFVI